MSRELCIMACVFCRDKQFHQWMVESNAHPPEQGPVTEAVAKDYILGCCGIESRNQLDTSNTAAHRFHQKIRQPFLYWKEQQQIGQVLP